MKTICSRTLTSLWLVALIIGANGCLTQSAIENARGHPDQAWINNGFGCNNGLPIAPAPLPDQTWTNNGLGYGYSPGNPKAKPHPAYYLLLPLSVPADIATSPFQLIGFVAYQFEFNPMIPSNAASGTKP
jgi:hypothetical protein